MTVAAHARQCSPVPDIYLASCSLSSSCSLLLSLALDPSYGYTNTRSDSFISLPQSIQTPLARGVTSKGSVLVKEIEEITKEEAI